MHKSTKLNAAIRSLYKSKAKECIVKRGRQEQNNIDDQMKQIIIDLHNKPAVTALSSTLDQARKVRDAAVAEYEAAEDALRDVTQCEYDKNGEFAHFSYNTKTISKERQRYASLLSKRNETIKCACQIKDSPEVLAFVADLSLISTVGEADALLAKLMGEIV